MPLERAWRILPIKQYCHDTTLQQLFMEPRQLLLDLLSHMDNPVWGAEKVGGLAEKEKEDLVAASFREGLQGLLYSNISSQCLPPRLFEKLRSEYYRIMAREVLLTEAFLPVAEELERRKINFLVLKGFIYSQELYSSPGQRPYNDVDLLVQPKDVALFDEAIKKFGFELTSRDEMNYVRHDNIPVAIDAHTDLWFPRGSALWESCRKVVVGKHSYSTLDFENQLVFLISHPLIQHGYLRLLWVMDFLLFLRKYKEELDQTRFQDLTRRYGLEIPFSYFFEFCRKHFIRSFPEIDGFTIGKPKAGVSNFMRNQLFQKAAATTQPFEMGFVLYFSLLPGLPEKVRFLLKVLFPDEKFLEKRHREVAGSWTRRIFRPFYILRKGIKRVVQWMVS